jgi:hypothetical protein
VPWLTIVELVLIVAAMIDVIRIDESRVKHLPKVLWVLIIIFLPLIGIALWFAIGRSYEGVAQSVRMPRPRPQRGPVYPAPDAASTARATLRPVPSADGRTTEQQLADLEREIAEDNRRRAELEAHPRPQEGSGTDDETTS